MAKQRKPLFNPSNKQFYVNYTEGGKAKRKYLGAGKNKSDRPAERMAKAALKIWSDERELAESHARIYLHYKSILEGTKGINTLPPAIAQMVQAAANAPPHPMPKQISDMTTDELDEYLEQPESQADQTARQLLYSRSSAERIAKPKKGKTTIAVNVGLKA